MKGMGLVNGLFCQFMERTQGGSVSNKTTSFTFSLTIKLLFYTPSLFFLHSLLTFCLILFLHLEFFQRKVGEGMTKTKNMWEFLLA